MLIESSDIEKRSIQTTITVPLYLYRQLVKKAKAQKISLSEIIRRALYNEFEGINMQVENEKQPD